MLMNRYLANELAPLFFAIPAFRRSLPSRYLAMDYSFTLLSVVTLVQILASVRTLHRLTVLLEHTVADMRTFSRHTEQ
jgi:hypothetical protein